jgi:hypothetical protein
MADETICRAREQEIGSLLSPILSRAGRSATLLYGDSGIGKSVVLREIRRRLSARINITAGFYECVIGDRDPLLRALDDLLKQTYAVHGAFDQIQAACGGLKNDPSISPLKAFLFAILQSAGESAGLGPLAKLAVKSFGWYAEEAGGLDVDAPGGILPRLAFRRFVRF